MTRLFYKANLFKNFFYWLIFKLPFTSKRLVPANLSPKITLP